MRSDVYLDSTCYRAENRHLVGGVIGAQDESSLFSSSLSDLVHRKLILSNKILSHQSPSIIPRNIELEPSRTSTEENEGQTINNLLPDEEELFSGIADEMGPVGHTDGTDDLEDFDLFFGNGGMELGNDHYHLQAGQRNHGNPWNLHHSQNLSNGAMVADMARYESSRLFNDYSSSVRMPAARSEFSRVGKVNNLGSPNFYPRSLQIPLHNLINGVSRHSLDGMSGVFDDVRPKVLEKLNSDVRFLGFNGRMMDVNEGGFGYSPNEMNIPQSMASKSNSYNHHHLRSLLTPNSSSFLNNDHSHHIGRLSGSPATPNLRTNISSPMHQFQPGSSAPLINGSLLDRHKMGSISNMGIPGFSPSYPREIMSSKNGGLHSPQQMSQSFHERSSMNSLPTTFGSPSERVRNRRSEASLNNGDRKHYELNIERILRGDDCRTTLMIKNIPNKYTSKMLLATIDEHHKGKYDFIYLPIDFKNKCNMGYAFINMTDPIQIVALHQTFEGRKWEKFNSEKVATLAYARIQGKAALIAHFQNSSLMNEDKRCRPILFHTAGPNAGDQEPFPMGTSFRTKLGRQQAAGSEESE